LERKKKENRTTRKGDSDAVWLLESPDPTQGIGKNYWLV